MLYGFLVKPPGLTPVSNAPGVLVCGCNLTQRTPEQELLYSLLHWGGNPNDYILNRALTLGQSQSPEHLLVLS